MTAPSKYTARGKENDAKRDAGVLLQTSNFKMPSLNGSDVPCGQPDRPATSFVILNWCEDLARPELDSEGFIDVHLSSLRRHPTYSWRVFVSYSDSNT